MNIFKRFVINWRNDYKQFFSKNVKWRWYCYTPILVEFEYDKMTEGISIEIVILGLGFYLRYNLPASDALFEKWDKEVKKILKKKVTKKSKLITVNKSCL